MDTICSRMQQRLYFQDYMFYRAVIESKIRHGITVWFGNLTIQVKACTPGKNSNEDHWEKGTFVP